MKREEVSLLGIGIILAGIFLPMIIPLPFQIIIPILFIGALIASWAKFMMKEEKESEDGKGKRDTATSV